MIAGIGHNSGRVDEPGRAFRRFAWGKARTQLLPKLPIEVVRRRVLRAKELGLPYKTYAGLRASSGDDLIGFLFSSNALRVLTARDQVSDAMQEKLAMLQNARKIGLAQGRVAPRDLVPPMQSAYPAPRPLAPWSDAKEKLAALLEAEKLPGSRTVLVCDTELELEWLAAARLAGAIPADVYFDTQ
ncbi:MAG: hypothetical protein AAGL89_10205 [Pseudomonadota bacterium]